MEVEGQVVEIAGSVQRAMVEVARQRAWVAEEEAIATRGVSEEAVSLGATAAGADPPGEDKLFLPVPAAGASAAVA